MDKKILDSLIDKINSGTATDEELATYNAYLKQATKVDEIWNELRLGKEAEFEQELFERINTSIGNKPVRKIYNLPRIAAVAASIIIGISVGGYFILHKQSPLQQTAQNQDIGPGSNKAILTLADGKRISLTDAKSGNVAQQSGIQIKKATSGQVVYTVNKNASVSKATEVAYNTIVTPRGGQYSLKLADGTTAYLDAASSIKFPVAFTGKIRRVEITGQVYFEVVHNAAQPFSVSVKGETVNDIGTHFNINSYEDEPAVKTTLIEGSVSVAKGSQKMILKPGQASVLQQGDNNLILVRNSNIEEAVAWKNGYFRLNDDNIYTIMRQLSRWYNIDVQYSGNITKSGLNGKISRYKNISQVLKMLESTRLVHFKIEGRRITVMQ